MYLIDYSITESHIQMDDSMSKHHLHFKTNEKFPLDASQGDATGTEDSLRPSKTHSNPRGSSANDNATVFFIGTATTVIEWQGFRILTDPNFLHAGDHVHLGPGVTAVRKTNPAVDLHEMPPVHCVLLSHYHEDHFDRFVENTLNRDMPIITTTHATQCLTSPDNKKRPFKQVTSLDFFERSTLHISGPDEGRKRIIKVTGMPGKHVPHGPLSVANDFVKAVPPTNGWLLEFAFLGSSKKGSAEEGDDGDYDVGYRIYISGDTLFVDELKEMREKLKNERIDLMLVHLGGTMIPGPSAPLVMVTMDAKQGVQLQQLMNPDITIPIHYDDYTVFLSPLSEFEEEVGQAGLEDRVVYLDRGEAYSFAVKG